MQQRIRFPLIALGMIILISSIWGGLLRLSWDLPFKGANINGLHGALMVAGFLGTLISLERAVALQRLWSYAAPLLFGLGGIATVFNVNIEGLPDAPGRALMALGSLVLVLIFVAALKRQTEMFIAVMALGAVSLFVGNLIWALRENPAPDLLLALWWAGFLIFTIAGERLELSRMLHLAGSTRFTFLAATGLFLAGLIVTGFDAGIGMRLAGAGMLALTLWLLKYDIARRTVKMTGLTRFIAICLIAGYVWLGISGVLAVVYGDVALNASPYHADAILHAIFLGFTFSMIFGHAPIIFPAVLGLNMTYRPFYYAPLVVLHLTLVLRVVGDLAEWNAGRKIGGLLNAAALLLFLANTAFSVITTKWQMKTEARLSG